MMSDNNKQTLIEVWLNADKQVEVKINSNFIPMVAFAHKLIGLEIDKEILEQAAKKEAAAKIITRPSRKFKRFF
jgi:hypothetical protein